MKSKETIIKIAAIISLAALVTVSAIVLINGWLGGHFGSINALRAYIHSFGIFGPVVLTLIQALQVVLPVLPGFLGCIAGAALFGPFAGFWVNYVGISAGSIAAFYLARRFGVQLVSKMVRMDKHQKYIKRIRKSKSYTAVLFLAILLPLAPDDFLCYFSGLLNMSAKKFIMIILAAKPWCILFYSIFFAHFL